MIITSLHTQLSRITGCVSRACENSISRAYGQEWLHARNADHVIPNADHVIPDPPADIIVAVYMLEVAKQ